MTSEANNQSGNSGALRIGGVVLLLLLAIGGRLLLRAPKLIQAENSRERQEKAELDQRTAEVRKAVEEGTADDTFARLMGVKPEEYRKRQEAANARKAAAQKTDQDAP
jgi:hypothetical protein